MDISNSDSQSASESSGVGLACLEELLVCSMQLVKYLKDATLPTAQSNTTQLWPLIQNEKQKYAEKYKELKEVTAQLTRSCKKALSNLSDKQTTEANSSVSKPSSMEVDNQLVKRKEELQRIVTEKNDLLKGLIDKLQELQFDINAMMTVSNKKLDKTDGLYPTAQTKSQFIK